MDEFFFSNNVSYIYLYIDKYIILNFYNISGQTSPMTGPTPLTHSPTILIWSMMELSLTTIVASITLQ